jgi:hypothetical protein
MASSAGGVFGVRRPGRFEVPDLPWGDVGHRQGLRDRLDEAVGEDLAVDARDPESVLDRRVIDDLRSGELVDTGVERGGVRRADEVAAAEAGADELRNAVALILAGLIGGGFGAGRGVAPGFAGRNQSGAAFNQGANFHGMTGTPLRPYRQFVGGPQGVTRIPSKEVYDRMSALQRGFGG